MHNYIAVIFSGTGKLTSHPAGPATAMSRVV